MSDAAEVRTVALDPGVEAGTPIWLVVPTDAGPCAIAAGTAADHAVRVGPLGAARAAWLGPKVAVSATAVGACDGLPEMQALLVPPHGAAVGLREPVTGTDRTGPFTLTPIGGPWWEVRPTGDGRGTVVFSHADAPPTAFQVATDPKAPTPPGSALRLAAGGVLVRPDAPITFVDLGPDPVVDLVTVGENTVVLARRPGAADGLWRVGDAVPEPLHVEVGAALAPRDDELRVPAGGHRTRKPDRVVTAALVADPAVLRVTVDGARLRFEGLAPGRTQVALESADGIGVIAVAVGY